MRVGAAVDPLVATVVGAEVLGEPCSSVATAVGFSVAFEPDGLVGWGVLFSTDDAPPFS